PSEFTHSMQAADSPSAVTPLTQLVTQVGSEPEPWQLQLSVQACWISCGVAEPDPIETMPHAPLQMLTTASQSALSMHWRQASPIVALPPICPSHVEIQLFIPAGPAYGCSHSQLRSQAMAMLVVAVLSCSQPTTTAAAIPIPNTAVTRRVRFIEIIVGR